MRDAVRILLLCLATYLGEPVAALLLCVTRYPSGLRSGRRIFQRYVETSPQGDIEGDRLMFVRVQADADGAQRLDDPMMDRPDLGARRRDWCTCTDKQIPDVMTEAFSWLRRHQPEQTGDAAVCWNDARLSNAIFGDETDFAWWLATRRQMLEVNGIDADPELPGFDSREQVIHRFEEMIGRESVALEWLTWAYSSHTGHMRTCLGGTPIFGNVTTCAITSVGDIACVVKTESHYMPARRDF